MKIDVVIPVWNGKNYIERAVASAVEQEHVGTVYVVDDGSSDGTPELLEASSFAPRIKIIRKVHSGLSATRNFGLSFVTSPWVAFLDADDVWESGKLKTHVEHIRSHHDCIFSFSGAVNFYENRSRIEFQDINSSNSGNFNTLLANEYRITGSASSVVVRLKTLKEVGMFNEDLRYGEDWDLWLKLARVQNLCQIPEYYSWICIRDDGMQRTKVAGLGKFRDSEINIYEVNKYLDHIDANTAKKLIALALWADCRKNYRSIWLLLTDYRRHLGKSYHALISLFPFNSVFNFTLTIVSIKLRHKLIKMLDWIRTN